MYPLSPITVCGTKTFIFHLELSLKSSARVEYIFAEISEELEIKLQTQYFANIETRQQLCSSDVEYSDLKCGENCVWHKLASKVNCSLPWMEDVPEPPCKNYKEIKALTGEYSKLYESDTEENCDCKQPCVSRLFSTYIQNRKVFKQPAPSTQIYIYYTTKLISMIEERYAYDSTQFIADVGGSLGFLLGLSVMGIIGMLEHLTLFFFGNCIKKMQLQDETRHKIENDRHSQQSIETVNIAIISNEKH